MPANTARFDDGAAYETMMGRWTVLVGERFLDWLDAPTGKRWLDIGCGNGAFTQLLVERCRPSQVQAFDNSAGQLAYASKRLSTDAPVTWTEADAMRLPVADACADVAVMALVLFFMPEPAVAVAEMYRAVRPGGIVAAYHWDVPGNGFPFAPIAVEMAALGVTPNEAPNSYVSAIAASAALWRDAGLTQVRTQAIEVQRRFDSFDEYWNSAASSNVVRPMFESMSDEQRKVLQENVRRRLKADDGPVIVNGRANAVCGNKAI